MEHLVNDLLHCRLQAWTFPAGIEARWLGEGILQLLPTAPWRRATILSAGVHGNETAPIELLLQLTHDLSQGRQPLTQALLIVFGNLPAIRAARRYLHNDLNRLFGGRHLAVTPGNESRRAFALEQAVQAFYRAADAAGPVNRGHLDMHTAIRGSLYRQFALLPAHAGDFSPDFYQLLQASGMDAVVRHTEAGGTFTHFTCEKFAAQSATLELGKVMPFGANDLSLFAAADAAIGPGSLMRRCRRATKRRWTTSWSRRASSSARGNLRLISRQTLKTSPRSRQGMRSPARQRNVGWCRPGPPISSFPTPGSPPASAPGCCSAPLPFVSRNQPEETP